MKRLLIILGLCSAGFGLFAEETDAAEEKPRTVEGRACDAYLDPVDNLFVFLVLDCNGEPVYTHCRTTNAVETIRQLHPFLGRNIRVSGTAMVINSFNRSALTGEQVQFQSPDEIAVIDDAGPVDFFASPELGSVNIPLNELPTCGYRTARGGVLAVWNGNRIILKQANGEVLMAEFRDGTNPPSAGETVEVAGIPETDLYRIHLLRAVWRPASAPGSCLEPTPGKYRHPRLGYFFSNSGRFIINYEPYGQIHTVTAALKEFILDENGRRRMLLEDGGFQLQAYIDDRQDPSTLPEVGSVVSVTGICVVESDFWRPAAPLPKNQKLFLVTRAPSDITVIKNAPWWTPLKFTVAASILTALLVLVFIWNAALRVLVERRSREVIRAQEKKLESELRVAERTRLAADLHDSLSQNLTVIGYQVSAARQTLGDKDPETDACLGTAAKMIGSCRTDLRRCLWDLRNDVLDEPDFATAIRKTVEPVAGEAELHIRFAGRRSLISDSTAHALLNIIRELVANAVRHGNASEIRIAGEVGKNGIMFSVKDNGCGFDAGHRPGQTEGHFGIDGIIERIERLEGTITIDSAPGRGTTVKLKI